MSLFKTREYEKCGCYIEYPKRLSNWCIQFRCDKHFKKWKKLKDEVLK